MDNYTQLQDQLDDIYDHNPFVQLLEIKIVSRGRGSAVLSMPVSLGKHTNLHRIAHGGAISTLADTAMGFACGTLNQKVVTLDMNINFMHGAKPGGNIYARATVLHHGKNTLVVESEIVNEVDQLLAKSRGTFFVVGHFVAENFVVGSDVDATDQHSHS